MDDPAFSFYQVYFVSLVGPPEIKIFTELTNPLTDIICFHAHCIMQGAKQENLSFLFYIK